MKKQVFIAASLFVLFLWFLLNGMSIFQSPNDDCPGGCNYYFTYYGK